MPCHCFVILLTYPDGRSFYHPVSVGIMSSVISQPRSILSGLLLLIGLLVAWSHQAHTTNTTLPEPTEGFPNQPIRIVVYTSPGGLIDLTARRFAEIARRYSDVPLVVINRPGGGGIVAFEEALQRPADGYTMLAVTRSNISKMVATNRTDLIEQLDWHSYMMDNPHVLIANRHSGLTDWHALQEHAREQGGRQLWLGADIGGVKHVSGVKMAKQAALNMRWIPYSSGGQAVAALLGQMGDVYLGNPRDALASDDLQIIAVAASERLADFPDAPTFSELGIPGLEHEMIWRGFALKKGVPEPIRQWYAELIKNVSQDPDWQQSWASDGVHLSYQPSAEFQRIVDQDSKEFTYYLTEIGLLRQPGDRATILRGIGESQARQFFTITLVVVNLVLAVVLMRSSWRHHASELMILSVITSLALLFYLMTVSLPPPSAVDSVGAQGIPRLWIYLLLPLALYQVSLVLRHPKKNRLRKKPRLLFRFLSAMSAYVLLIPIFGYWLATLLYLPAGLWLLKYRHLKTMAGLTLGWLVFSYWVFQRLLYVELPTGFW